MGATTLPVYIQTCAIMGVINRLHCIMEVDGVLVQTFIFMNVVPGVDQDVSAHLHTHQDLKKVKVSSAWLHILILAYNTIRNS